MNSAEYFDPHQKETISRLLKLGQSPRPVDALIDRLSASDGHTWLGTNLERAFGAKCGPVTEKLTDPSTPVDELVMLKDLSKQHGRREGDDAGLTAMAAYFLSVAAAVAHHGVLISSRSQTELTSVLEDLAVVVEPPFRELLLKAVRAPDVE